MAVFNTELRLLSSNTRLPVKADISKRARNALISAISALSRLSSNTISLIKSIKGFPLM